MNSLLAKENKYFETLYSKTLDRSFAIAFQDYVGFLAEHGQGLLLHLGVDILERSKKVDMLHKQQQALLNNIAALRKEFGAIADSLKLQEDATIKSSLDDLDSLIDGSTKVLGGNRFDSMQSEIYDFIRRLLELEHFKHAEPFLTEPLTSSHQLSDRKISVATDIKEYLAAEEVFDRQDINSLAGALQRLIHGYHEMQYFSNNSIQFEATPDNFLDKLFENDRHKEYAKLMTGDLHSSHYFGRRRFHSDLERIHNSIEMNNEHDSGKTVEPARIFYFENGNIYHHSKPEKLTYTLRGEDDPMYIKLFKNILTYMPPNQEKISIKKFKELLPPDARSADKYRANVGKSATSFNSFLQANGIDNVRPDTKEMVLEATDDYITFRNTL